jgi:DNA-binding MarR family transcriptional regulator
MFMKEVKEINIVDEVLIKSPAFLLGRLGIQMRRQFKDAVEKLDVGWQEQSVLSSLHLLVRHGVVSQRRLADFTGIDPRNLVPIIDSLEKRQTVRRLSNPTDRRGYHMQLTAQGETLAKQIQEIRERIESDALACLTASEKKELHKILVKLWDYSEISKGFRRQ